MRQCTSDKSHIKCTILRLQSVHQTIAPAQPAQSVAVCGAVRSLAALTAEAQSCRLSRLGHQISGSEMQGKEVYSMWLQGPGSDPNSSRSTGFGVVCLHAAEESWELWVSCPAPLTPGLPGPPHSQGMHRHRYTFAQPLLSVVSRVADK